MEVMISWVVMVVLLSYCFGESSCGLTGAGGARGRRDRLQLFSVSKWAPKQSGDFMLLPELALRIVEAWRLSRLGQLSAA